MLQQPMKFQLPDPSGNVGPTATLIVVVQTTAPKVLLDRWLGQILHGHLITFLDFVTTEQVRIETLKKQLAATLQE